MGADEGADEGATDTSSTTSSTTTSSAAAGRHREHTVVVGAAVVVASLVMVAGLLGRGATTELVLDPPQTVGTVRYDGERCTFDGPVALDPTVAARLVFVNQTTSPAVLRALPSAAGRATGAGPSAVRGDAEPLGRTRIDVPARPSGSWLQLTCVGGGGTPLAGPLVRSLDGTIRADELGCSYLGRTSFEPGELVTIAFENNTDTVHRVDVYELDRPLSSGAFTALAFAGVPQRYDVGSVLTWQSGVVLGPVMTAMPADGSELGVTCGVDGDHAGVAVLTPTDQ